MVEVGELLRELEGVLGEIGGLGCCDALLQRICVRAGPAREPERQMSFISRRRQR